MEITKMIDQYVGMGYETTLKVTSDRQMLLVTEGKFHAPTVRACLPWQETLPKVSSYKRCFKWFQKNESFLMQIVNALLDLIKLFHPQ